MRVKESNTDWSITGEYYFVKEMKNYLEQCGWMFDNRLVGFDFQWRNGLKILCPTKYFKVFKLFRKKQNKHFNLPEEWDEAIEFIRGTKLKYEEAEMLKESENFLTDHKAYCKMQFGSFSKGKEIDLDSFLTFINNNMKEEKEYEITINIEEKDNKEKDQNRVIWHYVYYDDLPKKYYNIEFEHSSGTKVVGHYSIYNNFIGVSKSDESITFNVNKDYVIKWRYL